MLQLRSQSVSWDGRTDTLLTKNMLRWANLRGVALRRCRACLPHMTPFFLLWQFLLDVSGGIDPIEPLFEDFWETAGGGRSSFFDFRVLHNVCFGGSQRV